MGLTRAKALKIAGSHVRYAVDINEDRATQVANVHGSMVLPSAQELDWEKVDAVFVCTPPNDRGPVEAEALRHGKHIFVEKPVHLSAKHGQSLLQMLSERDEVFSVGYMNRCRSSVEDVKARIEDFEILSFQAHWICKPYAVPWWSNPAASGGPINEQATHTVDLIRYLLGEVESVTAFSGSDALTSASVVLRMKSGCVGTFIYSCAASDKDIGLRIFTQRDAIALRGWTYELTEAPWQLSLQAPESEDVFLKETRIFLDAVASGSRQAVKSPLEDALKTQVVVDCIRHSLASSRTVIVQAYFEELAAP